MWLRTSCAARVLDTDPAVIRAAKNAAEATAQTEEHLANLRAEDAAWQAFLDKAAGPGDRYDQIRALGGMARARAAYRLHVT